MNDILLESFSQGKAHTITCGELFHSRRVLFASITRPVEPVTHHYVKYLQGLRAFYQKHNIEVILITAQPFAVAALDTYFPETEILLDRKLELMSWLAEQKNKQRNLKWLGRFWHYQALFGPDGLEHFTEQPTENRIADVKRNLGSKEFKYLLTTDRGRGIYLLRQYLKEDEELVFDRECFFEFGNEWCVYNLLFFYHLWPNRSLNQYLGEPSE
jgi:hypothetical protein